MKASLIIWLPDNLARPWAWRSETGSTGWARSAADKAGLLAVAKGDIALVISGQAVRILPHALPDMRMSEKVMAAGFAVEDLLGAPPASQHIVLHDTRAFMAIISRVKMISILQACRAVGIEPSHIYVDYDVVPSSIKSLRLDDRVIISGQSGYTQDANWAVDPQIGAPLYDLFSLMESLDFDTAFNLAQGEFSTRRGKLPQIEGLKRAAILAVMLGIAVLVWQGVQLRALTSQTAFYKSEAMDIYKAATGRSVSNPAHQIAKTLKAQPQTSGQFLTLSNMLFAQLQTIEGVEIDMLRYELRAQALTIRFIYPDFESASRLENALIAAGVDFQSGGVREQNGAMIGEAVIRLKPV